MWHVPGHQSMELQTKWPALGLLWLPILLKVEPNWFLP